MQVRIDTKNWLGNYKSNILAFRTKNAMFKYIKKIEANDNTKLIGVHVLDLEWNGTKRY